MFGNIFFILTLLSYCALTAISLFKSNMTGDQSGIWGIIVFMVLAAYVLCSLLLTINLTKNSKFDWLSDIVSTRNLIVGIGWLMMIIGVVYIAMMSADSKFFESSKSNVFEIILHYGVLWIPLLMIIPYAILLNPDWNNTLSPYFYKVPLLFGCFIGIALYALSNNKSLQQLIRPQMESGKFIEAINNTNDIPELIKYLSENNTKSVRTAAMTKIKSSTNIENGLIEVLDQCNKNFYFTNVYIYLDENSIANPPLLVSSLNNSILEMAKNFEYRIGSFGSELEIIKLLDVTCLIRVLDKQFKGNKEQFRASILKLNQSLEITAVQQKIAKVQMQYQKAIKSWLNEN